MNWIRLWAQLNLVVFLEVGATGAISDMKFRSQPLLYPQTNGASVLWDVLHITISIEEPNQLSPMREESTSQIWFNSLLSYYCHPYKQQT